MISKKDKQLLLDLFKNVDVKELTFDHQDSEVVKWFRFGSYNGLQIASEIVKNLADKKKES